MISKNLMANYLRRRSKGERSKGNQGCKTHPKHKQSPGVCSLCLGEKLSQLPHHSISRRRTITTTTTTNSSSSSLSSSASASSSSSPIHDYQYFNTGEGKATSFTLLLFSSRMKSKQGCDKKKNGGFFSKLLLNHTNNTTMVH